MSGRAPATLRVSAEGVASMILATQLRDENAALRAEAEAWRAERAEMAAEAERDRLKLASLRTAARVHESTANARQLRLQGVAEKLVGVEAELRSAEQAGAEAHAARLVAEEGARGARLAAQGMQAELERLREAEASGARGQPTPRERALEQSDPMVVGGMELVAVPAALRLQDHRVRPPSAPPWVSGWSTQYRRWYWFHEETSATTWDWPAGVLGSPLGRELGTLIEAAATAAGSSPRSEPGASPRGKHRSRRASSPRRRGRVGRKRTGSKEEPASAKEATGGERGSVECQQRWYGAHLCIARACVQILTDGESCAARLWSSNCRRRRRKQRRPPRKARRWRRTRSHCRKR